MSEEFENVGAVRRRPRAAHQQRSPGSHTGPNGNPSSGHADGTRARNGHAHREFNHDEQEPRNGHSRREPEEEDFAEARPRTRRHDRPRKALTYSGPATADESEGFKFPFDPWRLFGAAKRNWHLILAGGAAVALAGVMAAAFFLKYHVTVPLLRKTANAYKTESTDQFSPREYSDQTLYSFMKSGEVLKRVAAQAQTNPSLASLSLTPEKLAKAVVVKAAPNPDIVLLQVKSFGPLPTMVELANLYANEVVDYTRDLQTREAGEITKYLGLKLAEADTRIQAANEELRKFAVNGIEPEKATEADIRQMFDLQIRREQRQMDLDMLDKKIGIRQTQLKSTTQQLAPVNTQLAKAEEELRVMLLEKTPAHPDVQRKMLEIETIKKQVATAPPATNAVPTIGTNPIFAQVLDLEAEKPAIQKQIDELGLAITNIQNRLNLRLEDDMDYSMKKAELQFAKSSRDKIAARYQQAELFTENTLGYFSVYAPATLGNVDFKSRWLKVALLGLAAGLAGLVASLCLVMLTEAMDTNLKTPEDVARVTGLPVLATLGDLKKMSAAAQVNWAFKTLTLLRGKLSADADQALVCGIISARHGEGRSTWVNLLVSAASQRGLRVLTVDTRPNSVAPKTSSPKPAEPKVETEPAREPVETAAGTGGSPATAPEEEQPVQEGINLPAQVDTTLTPAVLIDPEKVAEQLEKPDAQPVVHIPLPGWVWNLQRRKQWQKALDHWRNIDNLVIFVELPPASEPESILLAEHLPQVVWLTGSGMTDAAETAGHLETLRHARCNLVGAVVNQAPPPILNNKLSRWFTRVTAALLLFGTLQFAAPVMAQADPDVAAPAALQPSTGTNNPSSDTPRLTFAANQKRKRAAWQQRLTFGPGDTMDIHFYGNPALSRTNLVVGPDGRVSYLQAQNLVATGLTVEELRKKLDEELSKYYTAPRTIVLPVSFTSKKYYMLGKVNAKGAYVLDRPLTIVEAVARAKGLESGLYQRSSVEMADLGHSFIVRNGEKLPVDFRKLFYEGDLSQNVSLEPDDYIYFASAAANNIYVLGEVMNPGPIGFVPDATVLTAITDRGGYSDKAYKKKILVVRGSLNEPETFVVDSEGILQAREPDFKLQPRDIVYVGRRPWAKAEELLDEAASSFIQGAVTTWAGVNVGPIIKSRLLPRTRPREK